MQIWKYHKQVCGPKSNPFSYPALSADEADLLRSRASVIIGLSRCADESGPLRLAETEISVARFVEIASHAKRGDFDRLLDRLLDTKTTIDARYTSALLAARNALGTSTAVIEERAIKFNDCAIWSHILLACSWVAEEDSLPLGDILSVHCALQQERGVEVVPPQWIRQALVADRITEIRPIENGLDGEETVATVGAIARLIKPIQHLEPAVVQDEGTGKWSLRCIG
ncbi:hypothetical protein JCM10296v2_003446 [Rhodotorula toruloides]